MPLVATGRPSKADLEAWVRWARQACRSGRQGDVVLVLFFGQNDGETEGGPMKIKNFKPEDSAPSINRVTLRDIRCSGCLRFYRTWRHFENHADRSHKENPETIKSRAIEEARRRQVLPGLANAKPNTSDQYSHLRASGVYPEGHTGAHVHHTSATSEPGRSDFPASSHLNNNGVVHDHSPGSPQPTTNDALVQRIHDKGKRPDYSLTDHYNATPSQPHPGNDFSGVPVMAATTPDVYWNATAGQLYPNIEQASDTGTDLFPLPYLDGSDFL